VVGADAQKQQVNNKKTTQKEKLNGPAMRLHLRGKKRLAASLSQLRWLTSPYLKAQPYVSQIQKYI